MHMNWNLQLNLDNLRNSKNSEDDVLSVNYRQMYVDCDSYFGLYEFTRDIFNEAKPKKTKVAFF